MTHSTDQGLVGTLTAWFSQNNDVEFTDQLIDHVMMDFSINPDRIHATGWSMGSQMLWGVACELSNRVASVAGVAGPIDDAYKETCDAGRPFSGVAHAWKPRTFSGHPRASR